jgi:hypothetical protein
VTPKSKCLLGVLVTSCKIKYLCSITKYKTIEIKMDQFDRYRDAALKGDVVAITNMGLCYLYGIGCMRDNYEAMYWLEIGA